MTASPKVHNKEILKVVAYFDVFEYPLTVKQIVSFFPRLGESVEEITTVTDTMTSEGLLVKDRAHYFLPTRDHGIVDKRLSDEARAKRMLLKAKIISSFIKQFPFIRGIFVTGSLSKNVAALTSDIDFMIVTAPERLWICKTMLTLFRKIFLLGNSKYFCTNYFVTEQGYTQCRRDLYTAIEVVTTKVIWNESAFIQFREANNWTKELLPNSEICKDKDLLISESPSFVQRTLEWFLDLFPMQRLDNFLMEYFRGHWQRVFSHIDREQIRSKFIVSPDVSSTWPDDRSAPILKQYHQRLSLLGLHVHS